MIIVFQNYNCWQVREDLFARVLEKKFNELGGHGNNTGVDGHITISSFAKVYAIIKDTLGPGSVFLDCGCGAGHPFHYLHFVHNRQLGASADRVSFIGFEMDPVGATKAALLVERMQGFYSDSGCPFPSHNIHCMEVAAVPSFEPATHVYGFIKGWDKQSKLDIGQKFMAAQTNAILLTCDDSASRVPRRLADLGLTLADVELMGEVTVNMVGSGGAVNMMCFRKCQPESSPPWWLENFNCSLRSPSTMLISKPCWTGELQDQVIRAINNTAEVKRGSAEVFRLVLQKSKGRYCLS
jgi:hypothetical protein